MGEKKMRRELITRMRSTKASMNRNIKRLEEFRAGRVGYTRWRITEDCNANIRKCYCVAIVLLIINLKAPV